MSQNPKASSKESTSENGDTGESLKEFINSFYYGSRGDLLFKFLKNLPEATAADFLAELLVKLGESIDDENWERIRDHIFQYNLRGYEHEATDRWNYDSGPFTLLKKPVRESRIGLLTSTGHFVNGDDPSPLGKENMTQEEAITLIGDFLKAEAVLSAIPFDTPPDELMVRHPGYDIRGVVKDHNVALPLDRMRELRTEGVIGELPEEAFSFVGATSQMALKNRLAPQWVERIQQQEIDAMLLVPV